MRRWTATVATLALAAFALVTPAAANAFVEPATGTFEMTTAPGILPTWTSTDISLVALAPGMVTTSRFANDATVTLPVVARAQTANATAGGFRLINTETGDSVRCVIPVVDTRARVIDCVTSAGYNSALFTIEDIDDRERFTVDNSRTTIFTGMDIRLTRIGALTLNRDLSTTVFSTSVQIATGQLSVTREISRSARR